MLLGEPASLPPLQNLEVELGFVNSAFIELIGVASHIQFE